MKRPSKQIATTRLQELIDEAPAQTLSSEYRGWERSAKRVLEGIFGNETEHLKEFKGGISVQTQKELLISMLKEVRREWSPETVVTVASNETVVGKSDLWSLIHPKIVEAAKSLFEGKHYSSAVFEAFKEVNETVKGQVKRRTNVEYDGSKLMTQAFSLDNPILELEDLTTESGRNVQKGYMQLFLGSMLAVRNPLAHGKAMTDRDQALHFLFLASLLMNKIGAAKEIANNKVIKTDA